MKKVLPSKLRRFIAKIKMNFITCLWYNSFESGKVSDMNCKCTYFSLKTTNIHLPCNCNVHVYIVINFCYSIWSFGVEANLPVYFIVCIDVRYQIIKRGRDDILLTGLIPPHFCVWPKPGRICIYNFICHSLLLCSLSWDEKQLFVFADIEEIFDRHYYKLFTFLSVDMEILTPWSSQVHPEVQPKGVQATEGC